jgi:hypothetical protein
MAQKMGRKDKSKAIVMDKLLMGSKLPATREVQGPSDPELS